MFCLKQLLSFLIKYKMKETFDEYKPTIESNLVHVTYLYDGDVINSSIDYYEEITTSLSVSAIVIINCINKIYNQSIQHMLGKKPNVIRLVKDNINNVYDEIEKIESINFKPLYVFMSDLFIKNYPLHFFSLNHSLVNSQRPFPEHFYKYMILTNKSFDIYKCPLINDNVNEHDIYITNKSIQSLVYSIQNMEYKVIKEGSNYKHVITYNLYQCDYDVYKISIKDLSTLREERINKLLND